MTEKSITEKTLEDYNDVFADIINVLIFGGREVVLPQDLSESITRSMYKADDSRLHEQERDVAKYWKRQQFHLALYGIENQTKPDRYMLLRVMGYEGAAYRSQYLNRPVRPVPVVTIILYFGERHWKQPKSLKELFQIPEELEEYVNDSKLHIFEIAYLDEETLRKFKSDFGIVADFFANRRKNPNWKPEDKRIIQHVDEVLKLLSIMTSDNRYEEFLTDGREGGNTYTMDYIADRLEKRGIEKGLKKGKKKGLEIGLKEGRMQEIFSSVEACDYSIQRGAEKMKKSVEEFTEMMASAGYSVPNM